MTPETIFQISSSIAMIGWITLIFISPFWWSADKFITGVIITLLAFVYAWLIVQSFSISNFGDFGKLDTVMALFTNKTMVTAGWVHYLAFDLFIGTWIKKNSRSYQIPHGWIIPVLLLTFMLGPIGLLTYFLLRWFFTKKYFAGNFD